MTHSMTLVSKRLIISLTSHPSQVLYDSIFQTNEWKLERNTFSCPFILHFNYTFSAFVFTENAITASVGRYCREVHGRGCCGDRLFQDISAT